MPLLRDAHAVDIRSTTNKCSGLPFRLEQRRNMILVFYAVAFFLVLSVSTVPWAFYRIGEAVVGVNELRQNSD